MENINLPDYVQEFAGEIKETPLHLVVKSELAKRPKIKQYRIAKALDRTDGAISQALNGDNENLLFRIIKYIQRYDRQKSKRAVA